MVIVHDAGTDETVSGDEESENRKVVACAGLEGDAAATEGFGDWLSHQSL